MWWGKVTHLFERPSFGGELWDELEELLISADVGVGTTAKLIEQVKQRVEREHIREAADICAVLKHEMASMLTVGEGKLVTSVNGGVGVILVVGVNGVGKTTSIAKLA